VFGAVGVGLVPWAIWLSSSLPAHHLAHRWDLAWSGFDLGLALCFGGTALAAWRRSPWVGALAGATGTLLLTDAWFDIILESRSDELRLAIVEALVAELPAAVVCYWIAYRTERFLARAVEVALGGGGLSHLAATGKRPTQGDLVGIFEVASDGQPAREARDADAAS
jgi:hypothetical protein